MSESQEKDKQCLEFLNNDSSDEDNDKVVAVDIYGQKVQPTKHDVDKKEADKKYKMEVLRKLLEEFDLEETIEKYKCMTSKPYRINVRDFSSKCSLQASTLKQRLIDLIGSDIIRLNDPKFTEQVKIKMWEEYEAKLDREEDDRAELERARMRRMMKNGDISLEELKEDPLFLEEYNRTKLKYGRKKPAWQRNRSAHHKPKRAHTASVVEGRTSHHTEKRSNSSTLDKNPSDSPPPVEQSRSQERPRTVHWESRRDRLRFKEEREEGDLDYTRWSFYNKFNDPMIIKLQDEESVDGLYNIAEELLEGKLPSQRGLAKEGKKKT